jgi:hypothetical protein
MTDQLSNESVELFKNKRKIKQLIFILVGGLFIIGGIIFFFWNNRLELAMKDKSGNQVDITIGNKIADDVNKIAITKDVDTQNMTDTDGDGLPDTLEIYYKTDKNSLDTDQDGILDGEEIYGWGTNPLIADTDGDDVSDYNEVKVYKSNPLLIDTDDDGYTDGEEVASGYNPAGKGKLE